MERNCCETLSVSGNDNKIVLLLDVTYVQSVTKFMPNSRFFFLKQQTLDFRPAQSSICGLNLYGLVLGIILLGLPSSLAEACLLYIPSAPLVLPSVRAACTATTIVLQGYWVL